MARHLLVHGTSAAAAAIPVIASYLLGSLLNLHRVATAAAAASSERRRFGLDPQGLRPLINHTHTPRF